MCCVLHSQLTHSLQCGIDAHLLLIEIFFDRFDRAVYLAAFTAVKMPIVVLLVVTSVPLKWW